MDRRTPQYPASRPEIKVCRLKTEDKRCTEADDKPTDLEKSCTEGDGECTDRDERSTDQDERCTEVDDKPTDQDKMCTDLDDKPTDPPGRSTEDLRTATSKKMGNIHFCRKWIFFLFSNG